LFRVNDRADCRLAGAEAAADEDFTWYGRKLILMAREDAATLHTVASASLELLQRVAGMGWSNYRRARNDPNLEKPGSE
jgi:hypothetical protein